MCTNCQRRKKEWKKWRSKKKIPICLQYFSVLQSKNTQKKKDHDEFHSSVIFSSMKLTAKWRRTFSRQISDNHFCLFRNFSHIVVYFFPRPVSIIYQYRSEPHLLKLKNHYLVLIIPPSNEIYSTNKCRRFYNINVRRPQTVIQKKKNTFL